MLYKHYEGKEFNKNGIYYYSKDDKGSAGFGLKFGNRLWMLRYSKLRHRWHFWNLKADPVAYSNFINNK